MTSETDAEFVADMEWLHSHDREAALPPEKLDRLFALARCGAAMDEAHAVGFREGAAHMQKAQTARIERLEAALRDISLMDKRHEHDLFSATQVARAALEGK